MQIKIKEITYIMMIITGMLIEKYGLHTSNPHLEKMFGWGAISLGSINMVISYFNQPKKK
jgi:hypothetical protein